MLSFAVANWKTDKKAWGDSAVRYLSDKNTLTLEPTGYLERKVKKLQRHTEKESATFLSSRSLLGREDLRGTLSHQSSTLRG
jgi:hypothetical protein